MSDAAWSSGRELGVVRRELAAGAAGVAGRAMVSDAAWIGGRELGVLRGVAGCGCAGVCPRFTCFTSTKNKKISTNAG